MKRVSEMSGVSRQTIYDLMKDTYPASSETQRGMAVALGVQPDWYDRLARGEEPVDALADDAATRLDELTREVAELRRAVRELQESAKLDAERQLAATPAARATGATRSSSP